MRAMAPNRWWMSLLAVAGLAMLLGSCSPYRSVVVGTPFHPDTVTISPDTPIGFPL